MIVTDRGVAYRPEKRSGGMLAGLLNNWGMQDPSAIPPPGVSYYNQQRAGVPVTIHTALQVDSVYTALRVLSNAIIKLGDARAYTVKLDKDNSPYRAWIADQPPILSKTWAPGVFQFDGVTRTVMSLGLFGEAFWYTLERDELGYPSALEVLNPAFVEIKPGGEILYGSGAHRQTLDPAALTHIPFLAMPGAQRGLNSVEYAGVAYALALAAMEYGERWFAQGASPSYLLTSDQKLGQAEVKRIAEKFLMEHSGLQAAHLPLVVDQGLKVEKIQSAPDEAQYLNTLEYARRVIAAWFGLPTHLVGGNADGGNVWGGPLSLDTPVVTPDGWTDMGSVKVGDRVIAADGTPTEVTFVSAVFLGNECFRVEFNDGSSIVTDADHHWETFDRKDRVALRTTRQIRDTLHVGKRLHNHRVRIAGPVDLPAADLPIDPYVLGVWLGDGFAHHGQVCSHLDDVADLTRLLADAGFRTAWRTDHNGVPLTSVFGLETLLRENGLLRNKHVPRDYLRGSVEQRLGLLQGLMDTDGHIEPTGRCEFTNTDEPLARAAFELAASLGFRPTFRKRTSVHKGVDKGPLFVVRFQHDTPAGLTAFRLSRKVASAAAAKGRRRLRSQAHFRTITDVVPVATVPVRCIRVAHEDHLFLVGDAMIPTHNTVEQQSIQMIAFTLSGYIVRLNEAYSSLLPSGVQAALLDEELRHTDSMSLARLIQMKRLAGVETANEIRVDTLKKGPLHGGDDLAMPLNSNTSKPLGAVFAEEVEDILDLPAPPASEMTASS